MLFKDLNKLKEYSDIANGAAFARIKTIMDTVERSTIAAILGKTLYKALNDAIAAASPTEDNLEEKYKELADSVRKVLGPLVVYHYAPFSEVLMSDSGMQRMETGTNKTAFAYQGYNYRRENLRMAEMAIEQLYEFLEAKKANYSEWEVAARENYRSLFIKSGTEFGTLVPTGSPYRNYYAMRSKMNDVELLYIKPKTNVKLFGYLKKKDIDGTAFTVDEAVAVAMLKKSIAYYTIAFAIPYLNVRIDDEGITVVSEQPGGKEADKRKNADDNAISLLMRSCTSTAQEWLAEYKKFTQGWSINENDELEKVPQSPEDAESQPGSEWPIVVECNGKGLYKAEDYNPRNDCYEGPEKKSFIM